MNRLRLDDRVRILAAVVEGNSVGGTARMVGVDKKTVLRLLADVGGACDIYLHQNVRGLKSQTIQCDEIWSFCHAKQRTPPFERPGEDGVGDLWTWIAIDADTKLIVTWRLGKRTRRDADLFVRYLAGRVESTRVQISTDGLAYYAEPIRRWFCDHADHGREVKDCGVMDDDMHERKYSSMVVKRVIRTPVWGVPDVDHISTDSVERSNRTTRMSVRRFTRLTNGFSKKAANLQRALSINFMYYNFCRKHTTIKTTPAIKAGLTNRIWTLYDLANLPGVLENGLVAQPAGRGKRLPSAVASRWLDEQTGYTLRARTKQPGVFDAPTRIRNSVR